MVKFLVLAFLFVVFSKGGAGDSSVIPNQRLDQNSYCYTPTPLNTDPGFTFEQNSNGNGTVYIIGDVNIVIEGRVPDGTERTLWSANQMIGFGAGAVGPITGLGESFYVNGVAHVRSTDNTTATYFQTIRDAEFLTTFSMFVSQYAVPDGIAIYSLSPQIRNSRFSLLEFYRRVHEALDGAPFCFHGLVEFDQLEAIAVSKAPIYNEPLFGSNLEGYYTKPPFKIPQTEAIVFGCAANFNRVGDRNLRRKLRRALYVNPHDPGSAGELQVHSHGLTVVPCQRNFEDSSINSGIEGPGEVYHLQSNSTIRGIRASVFIINHVNKLRDFTPDMVPEFTAPSNGFVVHTSRGMIQNQFSK